MRLLLKFISLKYLLISHLPSFVQHRNIKNGNLLRYANEIHLPYDQHFFKSCWIGSLKIIQRKRFN